MQHDIPQSDLGAYGAALCEAVQKCVHCGFCLPACPTYQLLGEEMDSPRGRIFLVKEVLEGRVPLEEAVPYIDRCLGCLGCVTACPSGVAYGELLTVFRSHAERRRRRSWSDRLLRWLLLSTLPYPSRFRWAIRAGRWFRGAASWLPRPLRPLLGMLPERLPVGERLPERIEPQGRRRARVALLVGCAQQVLAPQISAAAARILARNGVEVIVPRGQVCCGALAAHSGMLDAAKTLARVNLAAFASDVDAVITTAAGCGSGMREYGLWLRGDRQQSEAEALAKRVRDVSEFLDELGLVEMPPPLPRPVRLAYHDACHLAHAQRVREAPRRLLRSIPNVTLLEIPDGEFCCGSAGTYNLEHPELAEQFGRAKAAAIRQTQAEAVVTGNIGCMVQLARYLSDPSPLPVVHTACVLDAAYRQCMPW
jgi:glycolate oxidase iron-sulfur subunit